MKNFLRIGLAGVAFSGCAAEEVESVDNVDQALSSDATNGGTPGFFFLAPLGNPPTPFPGTFDGTLKARLTITMADGRTERREVGVETWLAGARRATVRVSGAVRSVVVDAEERFPDIDRTNDRWPRR